MVARFDAGADVGRRDAIEIDAGHGRFGTFEHDVLGLLDVEVRLAQMVEDVREDATLFREGLLPRVSVKSLIAAGAVPHVIATHKGSIVGPGRRADALTVDRSFHTDSMGTIGRQVSGAWHAGTGAARDDVNSVRDKAKAVSARIPSNGAAGGQDSDGGSSTRRIPGMEWFKPRSTGAQRVPANTASRLVRIQVR